MDCYALFTNYEVNAEFSFRVVGMYICMYVRVYFMALFHLLQENRTIFVGTFTTPAITTPGKLWMRKGCACGIE